MQQANILPDDYQPQDWYTRIPTYQVDAIYDLIRAVELVVREVPYSYPNSRLKTSWKRCIEALGGQVANPS